MAIRPSVASLEEIFELRWKVLRAGHPPDAAVFLEDTHPEVVHLAVRADDGPAVLGCLTLFPDSLPDLEVPAFRFRGMATAPDVRGEGYGVALLDAATEEAAARGGEVLWCHGRLGAQGFYERQGFTTMGEPFDIPDVGPHVVLLRKIN
ncbi:GNAT family N-acetyltransferase [Streptomyces sp. ACA25]|uniref:GNAT family N-acetyltransferase n=1 Tax=Streptomyces sp. ACA25 TaxID=3022596 RepID=UPI002307A9B9|nr:GNAT family N-acetyltransferase [Streptomyces sp. ACA25]MDB1088280.1 GNAT family N-acetyltransferase [Streptomyces sp. ACA25]